MRLHFFTPDEFVSAYTDDDGKEIVVDWWDRMAPDLLLRLDVWRGLWGSPIHINKNRNAIGRYNNSNSQHNVRRWGEVRAVDSKADGVVDEASAHECYRLAVLAGFTGVGFYRSWHDPGFHTDVRRDADFGKPATWGGVLVDDGTGKKVQQIVNVAEAFGQPWSTG